MKKILSIFVTTLIFATNVYATQTTLRNIRGAVNSCMNYNQYFKFKNQYSAKQPAFFVLSKSFNTDSDLFSFETLVPEKVYKTIFNSENYTIYTGVMHVAKTQQSVEALCGITFSCECIDSQRCFYEVVTNGTSCNIGEGDGTQSNPYVLQLLNAESKK